jgi:hypothetical protein
MNEDVTESENLIAVEQNDAEIATPMRRDMNLWQENFTRPSLFLNYPHEQAAATEAGGMLSVWNGHKPAPPGPPGAPPRVFDDVADAEHDYIHNTGPLTGRWAQTSVDDVAGGPHNSTWQPPHLVMVRRRVVYVRDCCDTCVGVHVVLLSRGDGPAPRV